jgi:ABC-type phosphate transport system auxiliary subunit
MNSDLSQTADAILHMIAKSPMGTDAHGKFMPIQLLEHHFGKDRMSKVRDAIKELTGLDFIELVEGENEVWKITPYGLAHVSKSREATVFSNISNSNIAHQSSNVTQSIKLSELAPDIQEKILEFDSAAERKEADGMKKAFAYIADKAVDVAIALGTGALLR